MPTLPEITPANYDPFVEFLGESTDVDKAISVLPSLFGESLMATYLGYRALGFSRYKAMVETGIDTKVLTRWTEECPQLLEFEYLHLPQLQKDLSKTLVRLSMLRNMMLCMNQDFKVLSKAQEGLSELTNREFIYLKTIRGRYTPADLLAIERIIAPEDFRGETVVNLTWDTREQIVQLEPVQIKELQSGE